jgi:hypothetical protein
MHAAAEAIAEALLAEGLPLRWRHTQGVARRAESLAPLLADDAETLVQAAFLHDVGYAPSIAETEFHPLDGARYLAGRGDVEQRVVLLVAHHSFARVEAGLRGLALALDVEFPQLDESLLTDALVFCDMTTTPDGRVTTSEQRVGEILGRYGEASVVGRFIRSVAPSIHEVVARIGARAADIGIEV